LDFLSSKNSIPASNFDAGFSCAKLANQLARRENLPSVGIGSRKPMRRVPNFLFWRRFAISRIDAARSNYLRLFFQFLAQSGDPQLQLEILRIDH
jgi:hypothetical protein